MTNEENNQMLNQMKVKEPETWLHRQVDHNASIINWFSMYAWSLVMQSRMADLVLSYGVHSLVMKYSGTCLFSLEDLFSQ